MKKCPPNLSIFLEQFHQHSSLPPVVIPHLGWDWRVLRLLLSVNIGTSEKMTTCRNSCVKNAVKALPRINIGLVMILIVFKSIGKSKYDDWHENVWFTFKDIGQYLKSKYSGLVCRIPKCTALCTVARNHHEWKVLVQNTVVSGPQKVRVLSSIYRNKNGVLWSQARMRIEMKLRCYFIWSFSHWYFSIWN